MEYWSEAASEGRFEVYLLGFHLAGIPTYMLTGELATNQTLWGELPRPDYPRALRRCAPSVWLGRAHGELEYCRYWATSENPVSCAGALAKTTLQAAHAVLAMRGIWALNEKRMLQWAGLTRLNELFANLGTSHEELSHAIAEVAGVVADIEAEMDVA